MHPLAYLPALIMALLIFMPVGLVRLATTEIIISNKRVLGRMRRHRMSIKFEEIDSVVVQRGIFGVIFNYGALTIRGNGTQIRFPGIMKPKDLKALIDQEVETALFGEILSKEKEIDQAAHPKTPPRQQPATAVRTVKQRPPTPAVQAPEMQAPAQDRKPIDPDKW